MTGKKQPGAAYAALPEPDATTVGLGAVWNRHSMRDFADATCALRASHGQAPQQLGVGNSGFDHKTAADFLTGKTVSDDAMRKFVAASRWAHDDRASLQTTLQSARNELASREAEIALIKVALMNAEEAAPTTQPADRHALQAEGKHPAPCARFCEANAFRADRRSDTALIRQLLEALQASSAALWETKGDPETPVTDAVNAARARLEEKP